MFIKDFGSIIPLVACALLVGCVETIDYDSDVPERAREISSKSAKRVREISVSDDLKKQYRDYESKEEELNKKSVAELRKEQRKIEKRLSEIVGSENVGVCALCKKKYKIHGQTTKKAVVKYKKNHSKKSFKKAKKKQQNYNNNDNNMQEQNNFQQQQPQYQDQQPSFVPQPQYQDQQPSFVPQQQQPSFVPQPQFAPQQPPQQGYAQPQPQFQQNYAPPPVGY